MDMGERIKQLRIEKGMTQEELGTVLGVQKSAVRKYEKGEVENMKRSSIMKLAKLFDVSPSFIMGWDQWDDKIDQVALSNDVKLNEQIQEVHGKEALEILQYLKLLNSTGKTKAVDTVADLTEIEKYSK